MERSSSAPSLSALPQAANANQCNIVVHILKNSPSLFLLLYIYIYIYICIHTLSYTSCFPIYIQHSIYIYFYYTRYIYIIHCCARYLLGRSMYFLPCSREHRLTNKNASGIYAYTSIRCRLWSARGEIADPAVVTKQQQTWIVQI